MKNNYVPKTTKKLDSQIRYALLAGVLSLAPVAAVADDCAIPVFERIGAPELNDPGVDIVWLRNQDGKLVDDKGCEVTQTQMEPEGDRDCDVWECLEDNPNPGVDQRRVLTDTFGDPILVKAVSNENPNAYDPKKAK